MGARQVPDDANHSAGGALERPPQRADDDSSLTSQEIVPDAHFSTFLKIFANPKSNTSPILASGQAYTNSVQNFFTKWQAGGVKDLESGAQEAREAARRPGRAGQGRRRGAVSPVVDSGRGPAAPGRRTPHAGAAAGRLAAPPPRARLMSPWIVGFSVFFAYPLVMSAYLSFNHYDLLSPPRWVGWANYHYLLHVDPQTWIAVKNTLIWMVAIAVPLQVLFAFVIAMLLAARQSGRRLLPDGLLPACARAARRGDARLRLHPEPGDRPGEHHPRRTSASRARSGSSRRTGRSRR